MKRSKTFFRIVIPALLLSCSLVLTNCSQDDNISNDPVPILEFSDPIEGQYTVVLKANFDGNLNRPALTFVAEEERMRKELPAQFINMDLKREAILQTYSFAFKGFTAKLTDEQIEALRRDPRVKSIEQDYMISLGKPPWAGGGGGGGSTSQDTPLGITRVGGPIDGTGKTAWIIDSGIDSDHPDLNVDVSKSRSYVTKGKYTIEDGHGHGTHVAGTVAAINNSIGVVGVAPNATIVALRVLDNRGSGSFSWTIAALNYIAGNEGGSSGDAVNMSLGPRSRYTDSAVDAAVLAVANKGLKIAIAAGNSSDNASYYSPARVNHNNVYTISAMDSNDNWASFSNFGSPVDYCAPGVSVKSTYKDAGLATMSGTSMASPHVCGLLLFGNLNSDGTVNGDPDGDPDPIAHN